MCIINKFFLILSLFFLILFVFYQGNKIQEDFYLWNIPTRFPRSIYDIRGYPNDYVFIHRGKVFNSNYIDFMRYPELYNYIPYYNNGMIYTTTGLYNYDQFARHYDIPILYQIPYNNIDWLGLVNNGMIKL